MSSEVSVCNCCGYAVEDANSVYTKCPNCGTWMTGLEAEDDFDPDDYTDDDDD